MVSTEFRCSIIYLLRVSHVVARDYYQVTPQISHPQRVICASPSQDSLQELLGSEEALCRMHIRDDSEDSDGGKFEEDVASAPPPASREGLQVQLSRKMASVATRLAATLGVLEYGLEHAISSVETATRQLVMPRYNVNVVPCRQPGDQTIKRSVTGITSSTLDMAWSATMRSLTSLKDMTPRLDVGADPGCPAISFPFGGDLSASTATESPVPLSGVRSPRPAVPGAGERVLTISHSDVVLLAWNLAAYSAATQVLVVHGSCDLTVADLAQMGDHIRALDALRWSAPFYGGMRSSRVHKVR